MGRALIPAGPMPEYLLAPGSSVPEFGVPVIVDTIGNTITVAAQRPTKRGETLIRASGAGVFVPAGFTLVVHDDDQGFVLGAIGGARLEPECAFHMPESWAQCITEIAGKDVAIDGRGVHLYDRRSGKLLGGR